MAHTMDVRYTETWYMLVVIWCPGPLMWKIQSLSHLYGPSFIGTTDHCGFQVMTHFCNYGQGRTLSNSIDRNVVPFRQEIEILPICF